MMKTFQVYEQGYPIESTDKEWVANVYEIGKVQGSDVKEAMQNAKRLTRFPIIEEQA